MLFTVFQIPLTFRAEPETKLRIGFFCFTAYGTIMLGTSGTAGPYLPAVIPLSLDLLWRKSFIIPGGKIIYHKVCNGKQD